MIKTCGNCKHFEPIEGGNRGDCVFVIRLPASCPVKRPIKRIMRKDYGLNYFENCDIHDSKKESEGDLKS